MIIVAHGNIYTFLHPLMWVFFCSKCVKFVLFSILEDYRWTNVVALIMARLLLFEGDLFFSREIAKRRRVYIFLDES